ncbi:hypothetical protein F8S09_13795 [Deinococcus sp. SDU3-2]|uniref:Uncharacterized protein n=1 Tax=Deinococcus terrestris TaxID=2651870 RepID=A0A7X1NXT4_9DEIO|nr:hypothetical protein [Deinococcus terrestris]MPY67683.1 hypothetical protein [Deinococcus terrestris]MPY67739.1 hypothetical protein [Deinococcus terrestris]
MTGPDKVDPDDWLLDEDEEQQEEAGWGEPAPLPPFPEVTGAGRPATAPSHTVPPDCEAELLALLSAPVEPHENPYIERQLRRISRRAYVPWTDQEDGLLRRLAEAGFEEADLARTLCRQPGAIRSRLVRLTDGDEIARQQKRAERRQRRQERREEQERSEPRVPRGTRVGAATPVPLELVVPHFEAWLALLRAGTRLDVMEGGRVLFSMLPREEEKPGRTETPASSRYWRGAAPPSDPHVTIPPGVRRGRKGKAE